MEAFDVLGDPVRRRILELLASGEQSAGEVTRAVVDEFGITQPAVSRHLRILRESGFAQHRAEGTRRLYVLADDPFDEAKAWIERLERFWSHALDALDTEIARQMKATQPDRHRPDRPDRGARR